VVSVRTAGGRPAALISGAKSAIAEVNRDVSLQFKTLALQVDESLARERLLATLSGFFGALAVAMIELYGVRSDNIARPGAAATAAMLHSSQRSPRLISILAHSLYVVALPERTAEPRYFGAEHRCKSASIQGTANTDRHFDA